MQHWTLTEAMALPTKNVKGPQSSIAEKSHSLYRTMRHLVTSELPSRKPPAVDLQAKEEEYKRLNAELEAKTANLVRQVEEVMQEQHQVLSKPLHFHLDGDFENENEDSRTMNLLKPALKHPGAKVVTKRKMGSKTLVRKRNSPHNQRKTQTTKASVVDDVAVPEDFVDFSGAKTIQRIEGKLLDGDTQDHDTDDDVMPSVGEEMGSDSQIRFLKAKLRVMQEELNRLSNECNEKDDENISLIFKVKQLEEDGVRLQKSRNIQQQQLENHIRQSEEAGRKCEGLKQQLAALHKETEGLKRAQTQAASNHSAVEVRLNRALEELERSKTQLNQIRQQSKDNVNQEHHKMEVLQAENKKLEKQKAELIVGFQKQLKLIDILKRQKMHFEAAKMLSFTEEEFMKALDWGK